MSDIDWENGVIEKPKTPGEIDWESGDIKEPAKDKGIGGHLKDTGISLAQGVIAVPEALVGLADIPTGGKVGKFLENEDGMLGFRPKQAREYLGEFKTDKSKEQQQEFQEADGILAKTGVALSNPSMIANTLVESAPSIGLGGVLGRGAMAGARAVGAATNTAKAGALGGAVGEGLAMAGSQASEIRSETDDGLLTGTQAAYSAATGALGTLFGWGGSRLAQRFGVGDIDTLVTQGAKRADIDRAVAQEIASTPAKSLPRNVIEGAITEGFLEELPQSVSEQILQNLALGRDWSEGIEDAAVMGTLAGMAMGAGAGGYSNLTRPQGGQGDQQGGPAAETPPAASDVNRFDQGYVPEASINVGQLEREGVTPPPVLDDDAISSWLSEPQAAANRFDQGYVPEASINVGQLEREGVTPPPILDDDAISAWLPTANEAASRPSEQMGLNPNAGPMSAAAATAVDSGASPFASGFTPAPSISPAQLEAAGVTQAPVWSDTQASAYGLPTTAELATERQARQQEVFGGPVPPASLHPEIMHMAGVSPDPVLDADTISKQAGIEPSTRARTEGDASSQSSRLGMTREQATPADQAGQAWDAMTTQERAVAIQDAGVTGVPAKHLATRTWESMSDKQRASLTEPVNAQQGSRWTDPNRRAKDQQGPVLQPRDRSKEKAIEQMAKIASAPNYAKASYSRTFTDGAPVTIDEIADLPANQRGRQEQVTTAGDRKIPVQYAVVEADQLLASNDTTGAPTADYATGTAGKSRAIAGNGRVAGLTKAWERGTATQYKTDMMNDDLHGIDPAVINRMKKPVLVRLMPQSEVTNDIGDVSNLDGKLSITPVEQAKADGRAIDLASLKYNDEGGFGGDTARDFVNKLPGETNLISNGKVTQAGIDRLTAAVFQKAYNNDTLTELLTENSEGARSVINALAQAAPHMTKLEGTLNFDIRGLVAQAAEVALTASRSKERLSSVVQQVDMGVDPHVYPILEMMVNKNGNVRSAKYIAEQLINLANLAHYEATQDSSDMFGEKPKRTGEQVIQDALTGVQGYGQINDGRGQESLGQRGRSEPDAQMVEGPEGGRERPADTRQAAPTQPEAEQEQPAAVERPENWRSNYLQAARVARQIGINPKDYKKLPDLVAAIEGRDSQAVAEQINDAASEAATSPENNLPEPTAAQKEAGNYAKGHIRLHGLEIAIENPRGSTRSGVDEDGEAWAHQMSDHYGYIKRTTGADGDHVDVYIGGNPESDRVFVVDQINQQSGDFDEHKVMIGFDSEADAVAAYRANFDKGWKVGPVQPLSVDEFKAWLKDGNTNKPVSEQDTAVKNELSAPTEEAGPTKKPAATKPKGQAEALPEILTTKKKPYLNKMARNAGIKRGSPGYQTAMDRLEAEYDADLDAAHAALPFEQYNELNSDTPESINRAAWEGLREDYGLSLETQTEESLAADAERVKAAQQAEESEAKKAEREEAKRKERKNDKARADETVDDFQLGQDADQQMSGVTDMFGSDGAPRFSRKGKGGRVQVNEGERRNLYVAHNLSAENILAANELGGLAAPSLAVANTDFSFDGYGEVTLLADPRLLEDKDFKTFDADVYSPRQPRAHIKINQKAFDSFAKTLDPEGYDLSKPDYYSLDETEGGFDEFSRSDAVKMKFLQEVGRAPKTYKPKARASVMKAARLNLGIQDMLTDQRIRKIVADEFNAILSDMSEKGLGDAVISRRRKLYADIYFDENGNLKDSKVREFANEVAAFNRVKTGVDTGRLASDINSKFRSQKPADQYRDWAKEHFNAMIDGKKLYKGRSNTTGAKRYAAYTLENVVKEMTKTIRNGENYNYGAGSVRSRYATQLKKLRDIQDRRDRFVSEEEFNEIRDQSNAVLSKALEDLKPHYLFDAESWGYTGDAAAAIAEGPRGVREAFGDSPEARKIINDLGEYLRNLPTTYFESKAQRAVGFNEFHTAVVPRGFDKKALQVLRDAGLTIKTYNPKVEGDRARVVSSQEELLFSLADQKSGTAAPSGVEAQDFTQRKPITQGELKRAFARDYPKLSNALDRMLERGDRKESGGLIILDSADPLEIARQFSEITGRNLDESIRMFDGAEDAQGFFDSRTGLTFLVGPSVTEANAAAVVLHEAIHGQQDKRVDQAAVKMLDGRKNEPNKDTREFLDRVARHMEEVEGGVTEKEAAAYIVEMAIAEGRDTGGHQAVDGKLMTWIENTLGKSIASLVRDFVRAYRQFALRNGLKLNVTVDDMIDYAKASMRKSAREGARDAGQSGQRRGNAVERNTGDVSPTEARRVQQAIEGRSLVDAARFLTQSSDKARAAVARKVLDKLEAMEKSGVNLELNVVHVGDSAPEAMASARAYTEMAMDSKGRDVVVWVNGADVAGKVGVEEEALLRELVHAATSGALLRGSSVEAVRSYLGLPATLNSVLSEVLAASEQLMGVGDTTLPSTKAFWHKRNARMITQQAAGKHATAQAGQVAHSRASGQQAQANPFSGFTREQFLGNPTITKDTNSAALQPRVLKTVATAEPEAFPVGGGLTAKYSPDGAAVFDGEQVIASYNFGDTLVVDKKHRRQGIAEELVYQWRMRNPQAKPARERTKKSQALQEKVWARIEREIKSGALNQSPPPSTTPHTEAKTGNPMRVYFARNTVSSKGAAPAGMDFGQKIEPAGEYMAIQDSDMSEQGGEGWLYGSIEFTNPLVLEHKSTNSTGWKKDLSEMFGGKTGKALANAVKKAGHDGIVTIDGKYGYSETVNLGGRKEGNGNFDPANPDIRFSRAPKTESAAFKRWFGDSKAVDANGKPLVVYHGSPSADIYAFDANREGDNTGAADNEHGLGGFYFTPDPDTAGTYARTHEVEFANIAEQELGIKPSSLLPNSTIYPVYLSIKNPLMVEDGAITKAVIDRARKGGHDGIIKSGSYPEYVVFRSEQVKSAIGNNGDFDPTNPDIRFSRAGKAFDAMERMAAAIDGKIQDRHEIPDHWTPEQQQAAEKFATFSIKEPLAERIRKIKEVTAKRFTQKVFDQYRSLRDLSQRGYMQAHLARGAETTLDAILRFGVPQLRDGAVSIKPDTQGFIETLKKLGTQEEVNRFLMYVTAQRANALSKEHTVYLNGKPVRTAKDEAHAKSIVAELQVQEMLKEKPGKVTYKHTSRENLFTPDDIKAMLEFGEGKTKSGQVRKLLYGQVQKEMNQFQKAILDIGQEAGVVNAESRADWESDFYIPFYRVMKDEDGNPTAQYSMSDTGLMRNEVIKRLKGGTENLGDPLNNLMANWSQMIESSMKNMAANAALDGAVELGIAAQVAKTDADGTMWTLKDGKRTYWEVADKDVLESLTALNFQGYNNGFMKAAGAFKRMLTTGVTISPTFRIRSVTRDILHALAVADVGYNPIKNAIDGWNKTGSDSRIMADMQAGGAAISFGLATEGQHGDMLRKRMKQQIGDDQILNTRQKFAAALRKQYDNYMAIGDRLENNSRVAAYQRAMEKYDDHLIASFEGRDIMNFTSMGSSAAIRALAQVLPFFNARLQGMYKLGRGAKNDPRRFLSVVGVIGMASALLYILQADDDEYKALPDYVRDTYWPIKMGDKWFYVPKPFEVGSMATVIERFTELAIAGDDYKAKDFRDTVASILINNLSMNPVPQIILPAAEAWYNYSMFRGRAIDSMAMERLMPGDRYNANTSAGAIALGRAMNISPQKLEHMVNGYFGWLGLQALNVSDLVGRTVMDLPTSTRRDMTQTNNWFIVGDFVKEAGSGASKYSTRFYDAQRDINQIYATANYARSAGDMERYRELISKPEMASQPMFRSATNRINLINKRIRATIADRTLSASDKTSILKDLYSARESIARSVDEAVRER